MKNSKQTPAAKTGWLAVGLIAAVLVVLFWRSFLPDYVHFSNDGPLGVQNAAWVQLPGGITGMWVDLNYLGQSGGAYTPGITAFLHVLLTPVGYAKYYAPIGLFILGLGAWTFFRQLKFSLLAATLGALAAVLNSTYFSTACWGLASHEIAIGMNFLALALIVGCTPTTPALVRWTRLALAGLCVGINVMEAADIGALFSMLVAVFVFFYSLAEGEGALLQKAVRGVSRVAVVAAFAGFIAFQTVLSLVGTSVQGVAGAAQDTESKAAHWDWATQWSLPKAETLGLLVPGLFGYKMDTPKDMQPSLRDSYRSGVYWGGAGRDPNKDRFLDRVFQPGDEVTININTPDLPNKSVVLKVGPDGNLNPPLLDPIKAAGLSGLKMMESVDQAYAVRRIQAAVALPGGFMRFTGGGNYSGILVLLIAGWAIAQAFRRQNPLFPDAQKRMIRFWAVVMLFCLLFAWGRFAPFYALLYQLPYFSTIRNPAKFIIFFSWALVIVFAYGVHVLNRRYLDEKAVGLTTQFKKWWAKASGFDRKWTFASLGLLGTSVLGWLIYAAQKPALIAYLHEVGFADPDPDHEGLAPAIVAFSLGQAGWAVALLAVAVGLVLLVLTGYFNGPRAKTGAVLLGGFLLFDMGRANLPWLVHWDYKQKYEVGSLNPVVKFLTDKPYEHRVAGLPFEPQQQLRGYDYLFGGNGLFRIEWMQQHFPYYNIQSLDIVQMPRTPEDMKAFKEALAPRNDPATYPLITREWMLTNTRYLLGAAGFLGVLNQELDPVQHRFQIVQRFDLESKPGITHLSQLEELTAVNNNDGDLALFEFTGALPRAKLYSNWQVSTNDPANLKLLGDLSFDPAKTVLVSTPTAGLPALATNENSGSVEFKSYETKHIVFAATNTAPSVLLLNDKFDPQWNVTVDGKPAELLRCNFIMRGVYLPTAGAHTVEFSFTLPHRPLYVTLAAIGLGILLCGFLFYSSRKASEPAV